MKTLIVLFAAICFLTACTKNPVVAPKTGTQSQSSGGTAVSGQTSTGTNTIVYDTIPDHAALKLKLVTDSSNYDETMFIFDHAAGTAFDPNDDSVYIPGFGVESLASLSSDGHELAISTMPYKAGASVGIDVGAKGDGAFLLKISYLKSVPADIQVIIRDKYLKDSADVRTGPYKFNIVKSDAATYGANRFSVVFRNKAH
jgi:hypothetical protein